MKPTAPLCAVLCCPILCLAVPNSTALGAWIPGRSRTARASATNLQYWGTYDHVAVTSDGRVVGRQSDSLSNYEMLARWYISSELPLRSALVCDVLLHGGPAPVMLVQLLPVRPAARPALNLERTAAPQQRVAAACLRAASAEASPPPCHATPCHARVEPCLSSCL